jgi:hypothetical protein
MRTGLLGSKLTNAGTLFYVTDLCYCGNQMGVVSLSPPYSGTVLTVLMETLHVIMFLFSVFLEMKNV